MIALTIGVALSCGEIREDELLCEEAVSRLEDCCPKSDARRYNCVYNEGCGTDLTPVLDARASSCIRDRSCEELVARGICDAVRRRAATPYPLQDRDAFEREACR